METKTVVRPDPDVVAELVATDSAATTASAP